ncbi:hypothetical protein BGW36DRAFT_403036 [Talaromyces proteolyticus]|uniref:Uncharacterized protein n=1 Tax=Talaromyces proteolyticus TaxID=1131652 RepID=A0AAD4L3Y7_9EURO|nr:uncharacterized protein BGW36DRAFT_403036 [Talaromyces proteolyticus]KAH8705458.1 hypothetical protein BGW36DRAFT_403036 [Talaromyces proteolyticus]
MKIPSALYGVLLLTTKAISHPLGEQTNDGNTITLYGYNDSTIRQLFYADGLAYFGDSSAWTGSVVTDVTFDYSSNPGTLSAKAVTNGVTLPENTLLYIRPDTTTPLPLGFTGSSTPSGVVTDRWSFYETYAFYEETNGNELQYFYVKETDVTGIWQLYWDPVDELSGYTRIILRDYIPE